MNNGLAIGIKAFASGIVAGDKIVSFDDSINIVGSGYNLGIGFDRNYHDYCIVSTWLICTQMEIIQKSINWQNGEQETPNFHPSGW